MGSYRKSENDLNYYGSDLNKFIDEFCTRKMTAINIDLLTYKRSLHHMRVIESKHRYENMPPSQFEALQIFSRAEIPGIKFGVYIVRGNYPFEIVEIKNVKTGESREFDRKGLLDFLNYRNGSNGR